MGLIDDIINEALSLHRVYTFDGNDLICQAAKHPKNHTVICLVTPEDAWTKELVVTATNVFGYTLKCGDSYGHHMDGLNKGMKFNMVDLGEDRGNVAIQFLKAKTFGVLSNFGTVALPDAVKGHVVAFFWPNDAPGDGWNNFMNILGQAKHATGEIAGVADNVVQVGKDAAEFVAMFGA